MDAGIYSLHKITFCNMKFGETEKPYIRPQKLRTYEESRDLFRFIVDLTAFSIYVVCAFFNLWSPQTQCSVPPPFHNKTVCILMYNEMVLWKIRTLVWKKKSHVNRKERIFIKCTCKGHFYISNRFIAIFTELTIERKLPFLCWFLTFTLATNTRKIEKASYVIIIT